MFNSASNRQGKSNNISPLCSNTVATTTIISICCKNLIKQHECRPCLSVAKNCTGTREWRFCQETMGQKQEEQLQEAFMIQETDGINHSQDTPIITKST